MVAPLSAPAPLAGDRVHITPFPVESWVTVAVMVVDCPAARDAPPLETRAMVSGAELPQPATINTATRAKIKNEVRAALVTEEADWDMFGILFLDPRERLSEKSFAGLPGPNFLMDVA